MCDSVKLKLLITRLNQQIKNLINQKVWVNKEGEVVKVSEMPNHYLLFAHRYLVNKINDLNISNNNFKLDDEIFKISIISMEGVEVLLKEIRFRNLIPIPSNVEVRVNFNELLKSKNDLMFKK